MQITLKAGMDRDDSVWAIRDHTTGLYLYSTWDLTPQGTEACTYHYWQAKVAKVGRDQAQALSRLAIVMRKMADDLDSARQQVYRVRYWHDVAQKLEEQLTHDISVVEIKIKLLTEEIRR